MKTRIVLFAAAVLGMVACNKENAVEKTHSAASFKEGQVVTICVNAGVATTKVAGKDDPSNGKFKLTWEKGDKIQVKVGDKSAEFTLSEGAGTDEAEFTGTMPGTDDEFDIQYPATTPDLSSQTYKNDSIPANTMSFSAEYCTLDEPAVLEAGFSVLQLNFTGTQAIKKIVVETVDASPAKSYTLNFNEAVTLTSTAQAFYVVTDTISAKLKVTVYDNASTPAKICNFTTTDKINLNQNDYGCVNMPAKEVKKVFSFSVSDTTQVRFTKGNLWWGKKGSETAAWHLEDNQTDYPTAWNTDHVGLFFWSKTASVAYAESYSDDGRAKSDAFFCGEDNKLTVDGQSDLYALSKTEWTYLISTRTNASSLCKYGVTVSNGGTDYANCLIIAPDDFTGTLTSSYTLDQVNALGLVCLPAVNYRIGSSLLTGGSNGYYWSASPYGKTNVTTSKNFAYNLSFDDSSVTTSNQVSRNNGRSVRLVYSVSE